jgi:hypothetical protein
MWSLVRYNLGISIDKPRKTFKTCQNTQLRDKPGPAAYDARVKTITQRYFSQASYETYV